MTRRRIGALGALVMALGLAACGSKQPEKTTPPEPAGSGSATAAVQDTRSPLEQRRDAACAVVGKRSAACAVEDTGLDLRAGKITKAQFDKDTAPEYVGKLAEKYADTCKSHHDYSSRQIRVLEKCPEYETECAPFLKCLDNVQPKNQ